MTTLLEAVQRMNDAQTAKHAPIPDELTGKARRKHRSKLNAKYNRARAEVDRILDATDEATATGLAKELLEERNAEQQKLVEQSLAEQQRMERMKQEAADFRREYVRQQRAIEEPFKDTLKQAARVARSMGFAVQSSKSNGRISSYYIAPRTNAAVAKYGDGRNMRLSDHHLPINHKRDTGYKGKELIIDCEADNATIRHWIEQIWTGKVASGNLTDFI